MLFVERRDAQTLPIDTANSPASTTATRPPNIASKGSTRYAELQLVDQHVNQRSLVVGITRHTHRYGMHFLSRGGWIVRESCAVRGGSRDKVSLDDSPCAIWRRSSARHRSTQLRASIEREREAAAERKAERERNTFMAFSIERELRDRSVRYISHDAIFKIMPEVRKAVSKIHYASQTEIMANIVQVKLGPKQSRGCGVNRIRPPKW